MSSEIASDHFFQMEVNELFDQFPEEEEKEPEYPVVEWRGFSVRLLNRHHSLWGDKLAEAGKIAASIILDSSYGVDVTNKTVLEVGAGSALPSMCCCTRGAKNVVATDYPDANLVDNIRYNMSQYSNGKVTGFKFGTDPKPLLELNDGNQFDILILSDVIFNHTVHKELLRSVCDLLKDDGYALVLFTHHRTHLVREDMAFFELAEKDFPLTWKEVATVKHPPMFADTGDMELRTTCHVGFLTKRSKVVI